MSCAVALGQTAEDAEKLNAQMFERYDAGHYSEALDLGERVLEIREQVLGPNHPITATSLNNLAFLYQQTGNYQRSLPLYQRALAIVERNLGPKHPTTATGLSNLAMLYCNKGDYQLAQPLCQRALAIREVVLGPEHRETAISLNNLAGLYDSIGDYQAARPLYQRALAIREKSLGPEHPETAISLNNLARLHESMGDHHEALPLFQRALAINEKAFGSNHPGTAESLNSLGVLYQLTGDYQSAKGMHQRALAIREKTLGPEHPDVAESLNNLAELAKSIGDYQTALPLFQRALTIEEKALGSEHPETANSLNNLAFLQIDLDAKSHALSLARRKANSSLATTANIFTFASERQRLAYQRGLHPFDLFGTLGSASDLSRAALRYKGLVLDSVVEDLVLAEASEDGATRDLAGQVKAVKGQLNQIVFETPSVPTSEAAENREAVEGQLREELEKLQSQLARKGVEQGQLRRAFTITPQQVQAAMPSESVLVEFLRYDHYLGQNRWQTRYGAVLLPKTGDAVWTRMPGKAEELEAVITEYKQMVRGQKLTRAVRLKELAPQTSDLTSQLLEELYENTWSPVEKALPRGTRTVIISPDGELNFLSFATLITTDKQFLAQKYSLTYVSSGRDLVAEPAKAPSPRRLLLGDPTYSAEVSTKETPSNLPRGVDAGTWNSLSFAPLPYTRAECRSLETLFKERDQEVRIFLGDEATEARVRGVQAPKTLHLATHGYFLPEAQTDKLLNDPMYRSGLALAGAQTTVKLRSIGKNPEFRNDGLLTAAEVGTLNLNGTRLVTLSACDTGSGESRAGEGVLGLRRGFVQAGAQNLVMTLWPVADKETSQLMQEFYTRAAAQPAPLAMTEVQKEWLIRLRNERSLDDAVRLAGPFVLTFQGRME
jgi:CHAT domain-containing protein/tetratricopeptide (TPR) repeat protein